ncbi:1517_t:CDS:2, partial [Gigaspora margarita]
KFVDPHTKEQHSLTTSQQLPQTELNKLRQPTLTSKLNGLSQQTVATVDSWSDIERDNNEPLPGLNNEPLSSLDMDNLSFLPKKHQQTSSAKINILDTKEQGAALVDEKLAEDIRYSNINEFEDFSAPNIDYENEFQSRIRVPTSYDIILIWLLKFQSDFKVSETGTEVLTKYIHQLLCEYVCPKCDKLYNEKEVVESQDNSGQLVIKNATMLNFQM